MTTKNKLKKEPHQHLWPIDKLLLKEVNNFMEDLLLKCAMKGMSQRQLAKRIPCSQANLWQYCKLGTVPGVRLLVKIRHAVSDVMTAQEFRDIVTKWTGY